MTAPCHTSRVTAGGVWRGAILLATLCAGGCGNSTAPPLASRPAAADIEWREVGHWSGGGSRQTESFEVSAFALRLRWQTTAETSPGSGHFTVTLHSAVSGRPLQTLVDARGVTSGVVDVNDEPRLAHLVFDAQGATWQATLEQGYLATTGAR